MKTLLYYLIIIFSTSVTLVYAQPESEWTKIFPQFVRSDFFVTSDKGCIVIGTKYLITDSVRTIVIKLDKYGNIQWEKEFFKNGYQLYGNTIEQTKDGNYLISIGANSVSGSEEYTSLIKLNKDGKLLWERIFDGVNGANIKETSDGGFIFVNLQYVFKTDEKGKILWKNTQIGGTIFEPTNDGGFLLVTPNYARIDKNGNVLWKKEFPGFYAAIGLCKTDDNGFVLVGERFVKVKNEWIAEGGFLMKLNDTGKILWTKFTLNGIGNKVKQTSDGGFVITGYPWLILKTNSEGNIIWSVVKDRYAGTSIELTNDGGCMVLGYIDNKLLGSEAVVIKYGSFIDPFIYIINPSNGSVYNVGSNPLIKWRSMKTSGFVKIELSTDGGSSWVTIRMKTPDDGKIRDWIIPNSPSTQCKIRITDISGSPSAVSDGLFTILAPSIQITSPAGGEVWKVGSNPILRWQSTALSKSVKIDLSTDGGATWVNIRIHTPDDGRIRDWIVPNTPSTQCKIRITDTSGSPSALSNGLFTIKRALRKSNDELTSTEMPKEFSLSQNFPNPFNPETIISYQIPDLGSNVNVQLKVYDILGREIITLINEEQSPGYYQAAFNGSSLTSGVYIYRLNAGNFTSIKKMILTK